MEGLDATIKQEPDELFIDCDDDDMDRPEDGPLSMEQDFPESRGSHLPRAAVTIRSREVMKIPCLDCNAMFSSQISMLCHKVFFHMHHYCPFCQIVFKSGQDKSIHMMMTHSEHKCDQCHVEFNSFHAFQVHRLEDHQIFHCPFCGYLIPNTSLEIHMKNHFIEPVVIEDKRKVLGLFDKNLQIVGDESRFKLKCNLCFKRLARSKVFSHIRYRHNFHPDFAVAFLAQCNFTLNEDIYRTLSEEPAQTRRQDPLADPSEVPIGAPSTIASPKSPSHPSYKIVGSKDEYHCAVPDCKEVNTDSGLHLLVDHGQVYCHHCDEFFSSMSERNEHCRLLHSYQCSMCDLPFVSWFKLLEHRIDAHHNYTCVFCPNLIINSFDPFAKHWKQFHEVNNDNMCRREEFRLATLLIHTNLFEINRDTQTLQCNICCRREMSLMEKSLIRNHFTEFHKVHLPLLFYFFNGLNSFSLEKSERGLLEDLEAGDALISESQVAKMHNCIICKESFPTSEAVQSHLITEHMSNQSRNNDEPIRESTPSQEIEGSDLSLDGPDLFPDDIDTDLIEPLVKMETEDCEPGPSTEVEVNPDLPDRFLETDSGSEDNDEGDLEPEDDDPAKSDTVIDPDDIEGDVGKSPVFLSCEICHKILPSMYAFSQHMRSDHKDSEQERNKPYKCEICGQGYYFLPSLNAHMSKGHKVVNGKATFPCTFCSAVTNCKTNLKRHIRRVHPELAVQDSELSIKCEFCEEAFWSESERLKHVLKVHPEMKIVAKCRLCDQISVNRNALRRHYTRMHPGEPIEGISCTKCIETFATKQELYKHSKEAHPDIYQCNQCEEKFKIRRDLDRHVKDAHPPIKEREFPCDLCGSVFDNKASQLAHMRSHKNKTPKFKCSLCGDKFQTKEEKLSHYEEAHPGEAQYKCPTCGVGFNSKGAFHNHKKTHEVQSYMCEFCDKTFNRRDSYKEHLLIHTGPRYRCPHCPKEFVQKSNLNRHIRIHLNIKPYNCNFCDKTFSDRGACKSHEKLHTGDQKMPCKYCGQIFSRGQKLRYHMRIHTGEGLLKCDLCEKIFTNGYSMKKHLATVHSNAGESCIVCGFATKNTKALASHIKKNHPNFGSRCKDCGLAFRSFTELNRHIHSVHRGERRTGFSCRHCDAIFNSQTDVRTHLVEEHQITEDHALHFLNHFKNEQDISVGSEASKSDPLGPDNPAGAAKSGPNAASSEPPVFTCHECGIEFNSMHFLFSHWKAEVTHKPDRQCSICSKKFKSHVQANKHLMDKHSDAGKPILKTEVDSDEAEMKDDDEDDEEDEEWPEGLEPAIALNIKEEAQEDA